MATVFKLRRNTTDCNLLVSAESAGIQGMVWQPQVATPLHGRLPDPVVEEILLRVGATSHDSLAGYLQALHDMQRWAAEYLGDREAVYPVWLHSQTSAETNGRRALVRRIDAKFSADQFGMWYGPLVDGSNSVQIALGLERAPCWEATTATTEVSTGAISSVGGVYDYTAAPGADIVGDVPARLDHLYVHTNAQNLSLLWAGWRSVNRHGSLASYDPTIGVAVDLNAQTDATTTVDATAAAGTRLNVDFATAAGWANRADGTHDIDGLGNGGAAQSGRHLALLRAKVGAGTTCQVRLLRWHLLATDDGVYTDPVTITTTGWRIHALGIVDLSDSPTIEVHAKRTAGSGDLYLDTIVLIPLDEYFVFAEGLAMLGFPAVANALQLTTRPDDLIEAWDAGSSKRVPAVQHMGQGVPIGDGRMVVVAAADDGDSTLTDTLTCALTAYPRWLSLRGAE